MISIFLKGGSRFTLRSTRNTIENTIFFFFFWKGNFWSLTCEFRLLSSHTRWTGEVLPPFVRILLASMIDAIMRTGKINNIIHVGQNVIIITALCTTLRDDIADHNYLRTRYDNTAQCHNKKNYYYYYY